MSDYNHGDKVVLRENIDVTLTVDVNGKTKTLTLGEALTQYFSKHGHCKPPVCFVAGTRIRTARGEVAVETLEIGDLAVTASGEHRAIRWLGHRSVECGSNPSETRPIRIVAGAFGTNRPARDLLVSPGHAICVDVLGEVLIPAGSLIDGATIAQVAVDEVEYWHVELDSHDVLLAENLPCESYIDMGNRAFFVENDVVMLDAVPDTPAASVADCIRPFHIDGPVVGLVRGQLATRAAQRAEHDAVDHDGAVGIAVGG